MKIKIERNISSSSSFEYPFCLVDESGTVVARCENIAIAVERLKDIRTWITFNQLTT